MTQILLAAPSISSSSSSFPSPSPSPSPTLRGEGHDDTNGHHQSAHYQQRTDASSEFPHLKQSTPSRAAVAAPSRASASPDTADADSETETETIRSESDDKSTVASTVTATTAATTASLLSSSSKSSSSSSSGAAAVATPPAADTISSNPSSTPTTTTTTSGMGVADAVSDALEHLALGQDQGQQKHTKSQTQQQMIENKPKDPPRASETLATGTDGANGLKHGECGTCMHHRGMRAIKCEDADQRGDEARRRDEVQTQQQEQQQQQQQQTHTHTEQSMDTRPNKDTDTDTDKSRPAWPRSSSNTPRRTRDYSPTSSSTTSNGSSVAVPETLISPRFTPPTTPGGSPDLARLPSTAERAREREHQHAVAAAAAAAAATIPAQPVLASPAPQTASTATSLTDTLAAAAAAAPSSHTHGHNHLLPRLPHVECVVRARIPTTTGAEMFLHLYTNDVDNKEHLAIVFGSEIRSRSLDAVREGETEMDRMIRGAYVGRLRPGRTSSRYDYVEEEKKARARGQAQQQQNNGNGNGSSSANAGARASTTTETTARHEQENATATAATTTNMSSSTYSASSSSSSDSSTSSIASGASAATTVEVDPATNCPITAPSQPPLVRIHSECYTGETAWSARCDCGEQLDEAARLMSEPQTAENGGEGSSSTTTTTGTRPPPGGVIVYLRQEGRGIGLGEKLKAYNLQDLGSDTVEANLLLRHPADARSYGLATAILVDLGLGRDSRHGGIRLLTNNPDKVRAVEGPGREVKVLERVPMIPIAWRTGGKKGIKSTEIEGYLRTKIEKMAHMIE